MIRTGRGELSPKQLPKSLLSFCVATNMRSLLDVFADQENTFFTWDTDFPEPILSDALRIVKREEYGDRDLNKDRLSAKDLVHDVELVRELLYHFRVPDDQVDNRMAAMGMLPYWRALSAIVTQPSESICRSERQATQVPSSGNRISHHSPPIRLSA
ncbi:hypothetical protein B0H13DRAFT_1158755 [Mycena leptocephala]|nr:hypothetical protein B0H13DRAFT_1158755 [Mycena leptocephala]